MLETLSGGRPVRARTSPLWWAVAAYAGHWAMKAETDVGSVMNYVAKASLVVFVVTLCLPAFRDELRGQGSEDRGRTREDGTSTNADGIMQNAEITRRRTTRRRDYGPLQKAEAVKTGSRNQKRTF